VYDKLSSFPSKPTISPWSRVLREKLIGPQQIKNFPHFIKPGCSSSPLQEPFARHLSILSQTNQSTSPITSWRAILIHYLIHAKYFYTDLKFGYQNKCANFVYVLVGNNVSTLQHTSTVTDLNRNQKIPLWQNKIT
jgi:hypothetical protein